MANYVIINVEGMMQDEPKEDKPKGFQVKMSPAFIEQLSKFDPEVRAEIMASIANLSSNPYMGTPIYGGFLNYRVILNWFMRTWFSLKGRKWH